MTDINDQKNLSNFRKNRLGGIDADWTMPCGGVVPYTLEEGELEQATDVAEFDADGFEQQASRATLLAELAAIDTATVRPLRAVMAGSGTDADKERLAELEAKAEEIRAKLA